jgi:hypothetical protein
MPNQDITQQQLKSLYDYDAHTGEFTHRRNTGRSARPGTVAGSICRKGYVQMKIYGKMYSAHRLAWLYVTGSHPVGEIDHINRIRNDNRFCNLRVAARGSLDNSQNRKIRSDNTSGYTGVHFHKKYKKWGASICFNGNQQTIGYFDSAEIAHIAYCEKKRELHSFHPLPVL